MSDDAHARSLNRNALTAVTFVEIVDTLVDDFDVIDVLTVLTSRSVELLEAAAAGILLADTAGHLRVMAASTEQIELLELFQIQNDEGPVPRLLHTPAPSSLDHDLGSPSPWPQFATESVAAGFPSVCAVPLRLRDVILGCLNLFMSHPCSLSAADVAARPGARRRRQHRHRPGPGHTRSRDPRGPIAARPQQPHRHRAGQGHDRRTWAGSTWTPRSSILRRFAQEQQSGPHRGRRSPRRRNDQHRHVVSRTASAATAAPGTARPVAASPLRARWSAPHHEPWLCNR